MHGPELAFSKKLVTRSSLTCTAAKDKTINPRLGFASIWETQHSSCPVLEWDEECGRVHYFIEEAVNAGHSEPQS